MNTTWRLVIKGYGVPLFFIEAINTAPPSLTHPSCKHKVSSLRIDGPLYVQGSDAIGYRKLQAPGWNHTHPCMFKACGPCADGPLYVQGLNATGCHKAQSLHWGLGHPCTYKGDDGAVVGALYVQGLDAIGCRKDRASARAPGRRRSKRPMPSRRAKSPHTYPALAGFGVSGASDLGDLR